MLTVHFVWQKILATGRVPSTVCNLKKGSKAKTSTKTNSGKKNLRESFIIQLVTFLGQLNSNITNPFTQVLSVLQKIITQIK
jgi:hypothetical protein